VTEPVDSTDVRSGAAVHDALLALLPLIGEWDGEGVGVAGDCDEFRFRQRARFAHDGRPFLAYESRSWLVDETGQTIRSAWRESGFWRPGPGPDDVELVLASNTGQALVFVGTAGDQRWDLETVSAEHAPTGLDVTGERRLYAVRADQLVYATELAPGGAPYAPHLNAELSRV
jgi:THAP4-like, heme-binding beta-barrel domain